MMIRIAASALLLIVPTFASAQAPELPLDQVIAEIKAAPNDQTKVRFSGETRYTKPLQHLSQHKVDPKRREEVATLLDPLILANDRDDRAAALHLVVKWGTETNVPKLSSLLTLDNSFDRGLAINGLGAIGGKNAAAALGKQILAGHDQQEISNALKEVGVPAEPIAWQLIESRDGWSVKYGYEILGEVGGSKSLVRLKGLRTKAKMDTDKMDQAIRAMELRLKKR